MCGLHVHRQAERPHTALILALGWGDAPLCSTGLSPCPPLRPGSPPAGGACMRRRRTCCCCWWWPSWWWWWWRRRCWWWWRVPVGWDTVEPAASGAVALAASLTCTHKQTQLRPACNYMLHFEFGTAWPGIACATKRYGMCACACGCAVMHAASSAARLPKPRSRTYWLGYASPAGVCWEEPRGEPSSTAGDCSRLCGGLVLRPPAWGEKCTRREGGACCQHDFALGGGRGADDHEPRANGV